MVNVMTIASRTTNEPNAMRNHFPNRLIWLFSVKAGAAVEHEATVATAVPDPQGADANQTAHAVARHRRDQGACCVGQQAVLAERAQAAFALTAF